MCILHILINAWNKICILITNIKTTTSSSETDTGFNVKRVFEQIFQQTTIDIGGTTGRATAGLVYLIVLRNW